MRVQILSTYYAPEHTGNAPYVTGLAEYLSNAHDVTVIAGVPHYPEWRVPTAWRGWRYIDVRPRMRIVRVGLYVPRRQDSIRRAAYEAVWAARATAEGMRYPADAVIAFVPTLLTAQAASMVARRHKSPLGLVIQDIVSRAAEHSGIAGGRAAADWAAKLERRGLARAQRISTIHPRMADVLTREYAVPPAKIDVIYNWTHISRPRADRAAARARFGWSENEIVALHSGNMGMKQNLESVVAAAKLASNRNHRVRFVLAGDGNQREMIETLAAGIDTLEIRDPVPSTDFPDFLASADVLLVNELPGVFEMSVPSKLTSYFASGRPVVVATESTSATAQLVSESKAGIQCPPNDPEALLNAVQTLGAGDAISAETGANGQRFASEHLTAKSALARYSEWLERLVND